MRFPYVPLAFVSFIAIAGCAKTESSSLLTSGVSAEITVTADGSGNAVASAELFDGDPLRLNFLELEGNDALLVSSGTSSARLSRSEFLNIVSYSATLPGAGRDGQSFTVDFQRTVDKGAPESTCTIPDSFALSPPAANSPISRANSDMTLTWSPSGLSDAMSYQVSGDCVQTLTKSISGDPGTVTIPKGSVVASNTSQPGTCNINIAVLRQRAGHLDSNYGKGGSIYGVQSRSVTVQSAP